MKYLVDANVLTEPTKSASNSRVVDWLERHERELVVDPIILGELRFGILLLPKGRRRARLERWFDTGVRHIQCVSWELATGMRWAQLLAELRRKGRAMPIKDSLIAATALANDFTVATHNLADFEKAGVRIVDPFSSR